MIMVNTSSTSFAIPLLEMLYWTRCHTVYCKVQVKKVVASSTRLQTRQKSLTWPLLTLIFWSTVAWNNFQVSTFFLLDVFDIRICHLYILLFYYSKSSFYRRLLSNKFVAVVYIIIGSTSWLATTAIQQPSSLNLAYNQGINRSWFVNDVH